MEFKSESLSFSNIYRGIVIDNEDPDKTGKCRIRVHLVFDDAEDEHLPWAVPALPVFTGSGNGYGWFAIPEVGSEVFVFFEANDFYQPVYFAEAISGIHGHPDLGDTNYPDRRGFQTPSGHKFYVDDSANVIHFEHSDGGKIDISSTSIEAEIGSAKIIMSSDGTVNINP